MELSPLFNKSKGTSRKLSGNLSGCNIDRDLVIPVDGVEMGRRMLTRENTDYDPKEARYFGHDLRWCQTKCRAWQARRVEHCLDHGTRSYSGAGWCGIPRARALRLPGWERSRPAAC